MNHPKQPVGAAEVVSLARGPIQVLESFPVRPIHYGRYRKSKQLNYPPIEVNSMNRR